MKVQLHCVIDTKSGGYVSIVRGEEKMRTRIVPAHAKQAAASLKPVIDMLFLSRIPKP